MNRSSEVTTELQLGTRKVTVMNFSRFVTLPLDFVKNLDESMLVNVSMTPDRKKVTITPAEKKATPS